MDFLHNSEDRPLDGAKGSQGLPTLHSCISLHAITLTHPKIQKGQKGVRLTDVCVNVISENCRFR